MANKSTSYLLDHPEALSKEKIRLKKQAEIFFGIEQKALRSKVEGKAVDRVVLDLGSGPGIYLSMFGEGYSTGRLFGYERNRDLISECRDKFPHIKVHEGDLLDRVELKRVVLEVSPEILIMRFVLHHLNESERRGLLDQLSELLKIGQKIFIIEIDDSQIQMSHHNPLIDAAIARTIKIQGDRGGDRLIGKKIRLELERSSFLVSCDETVCLTSKDFGVEIIVQTIVPIWKTFSPSDSESDREKVLRDLTEVSEWLSKMGDDESFNFSFPIRVFVAEKQF